jgi:hypothetical protein
LKRPMNRKVAAHEVRSNEAKQGNLFGKSA